MDSRFLRSQSALRSAVLDAAAARPIGEVTAAEVCRAAEVARC
ncbi:hypothetical protein [Schumannella soli]|nr:hypothetical protein [Schumannella soli]